MYDLSLGIGLDSIQGLINISNERITNSIEDKVIKLDKVDTQKELEDNLDTKIAEPVKNIVIDKNKDEELKQDKEKLHQADNKVKQDAPTQPTSSNKNNLVKGTQVQMNNKNNVGSGGENKIDYSKLTEADLWEYVKEFMLKNGVKQAPVPSYIVEDAFGAKNILRLVKKLYLIPRKSGYTMTR